MAKRRLSTNTKTCECLNVIYNPLEQWGVNHHAPHCHHSITFYRSELNLYQRSDTRPLPGSSARTMTQYTTPNNPTEKDEQGYNGWHNYETWCVNLWLTNDYADYTYIRDLIKKANNIVDAAEQIREMVEEMNPIAEQATLYTDLLNGALRAVDWFEIAQHFLED